MTRLAIVKPDYGGRGGFERGLATLIDRERTRGLDVDVISISTAPPQESVFGYPIEPVLLEWHPGYFEYLAMVERVQRLDLTGYDAIVATQPPTYHAAGAPVLGLFYHHARIFYDLAEEYVAAGFVDADVHRVACSEVRHIDRTAVDGVAHWLAGSNEVAARLERYWQLSGGKVGDFQLPNVADIPPQPPEGDPGTVICVSRQEWPKRTELVVAAASLLTDSHVHLVGGGSRLDFVRSLDAELGASPGPRLEPGRSFWSNRGVFEPGWQPSTLPPSGRVTFHGSTSDADRDRLYGAAGIAVAPALDEDYGLTALEAFAWHRPIVVCSDGGGLHELVEHEVSGLVVDPEPSAIASAIERLQSDPALRAEVVAGGVARLEECSWPKAIDQFEGGLARVLPA